MKKLLIFLGIATFLFLFILPDCCVAADTSFNIIFRYGVGARNELNTFNGTFTKDMVSAPSVTIALDLTPEEMETIVQKMVEIGFFEYPDDFSIKERVPENGSLVTERPNKSYYFIVEYGSRRKELRWEDGSTCWEVGQEIVVDEKARKLEELALLIEGIIKAKEEYQKLPLEVGGYE
jgi:hypothetical protein